MFGPGLERGSSVRLYTVTARASIYYILHGECLEHVWTRRWSGSAAGVCTRRPPNVSIYNVNVLTVLSDEAAAAENTDSTPGTVHQVMRVVATIVAHGAGRADTNT